MSEGEEVPAAAGQIYGFRYWRMTGAGHLTSLVIEAPQWNDGENVAICHRTTQIAPNAPGPNSNATFSFPNNVSLLPPKSGNDRLIFPWLQSSPPLVHTSPDSSHAVPNEACKCGFYMVRDHQVARNKYVSSYDGDKHVLGIVQGYGRVIEYTDGWRFEKARIVAIAPTFPDRRTAMFVYRRDAHRAVRVDLESGYASELLQKNYPSATYFADVVALLQYSTELIV